MDWTIIRYLAYAVALLLYTLGIICVTSIIFLIIFYIRDSRESAGRIDETETVDLWEGMKQSLLIYAELLAMQLH